jgi:LDH2 family malate/lactate/ureidoglycolate dehydrogenase
MSRRVRISELRGAAAEVLRRLGHSDDHAAQIAEVLVDCDLRGYEDHGVALLGLFPMLVQAGRYNPRPQIRVVGETESTLLLDGDRGLGVVPGLQAMRWCVERARARGGIACAAVRHAGHVIASAPYVELAAREGLVGFACANADPMMAAPGGRTKVVGNNPLAFAAPAGRHEPLLFDMATSATAGQKMRLAALAGQTVPEGLIADSQGQPTTDPRAFWPPAAPIMAGALLPLGWPPAGHKGFGLALLVEVLAGVLAGGGFGQTARVVAGDTGQFYWALDVRPFLPLEEFRARVDALADQIKAGERLAGVDEVLVPGERGQRRRAARLAEGVIPLAEESWGQFVKGCQAAGVTPPASAE